MADLNLMKGDRVLVEMTVERGTPDAAGDIHGRVEGWDVWLPLDKIHPKVYIPIDEPQTIGSVVRAPSGARYTRYTENPLSVLPWVSEEYDLYTWDEIHEPELVT